MSSVVALILAFLLMLTQEMVMLSIAISICMLNGLGPIEIFLMWLASLQVAIVLAHKLGSLLRGRLPRFIEERRRVIEAWLRRHNMMAVYVLFSFLVWAYAVVIVLTILGERLKRILVAVNIGYGTFFVLLLLSITAGVELTGNLIMAVLLVVVVFAAAISLAYRAVARSARRAESLDS